MEKFENIKLPSVVHLHPLFITHKPADLVIKTTRVRERGSSRGRSDSNQCLLDVGSGRMIAPRLKTVENS